ncbi:kinase-like domain-containing protein [Desarmillaria tabescens]|uniref:Kinase-like domain-containing protein n=1 Tax=Armillaria tabescens TaxID=1929756 RepID=A0AA39MXF4_ARMTA|nr:kinase-like domain-containing protein [Desarmillaria tabescens]KAK0449793.1 kinase-like domain-containing protein [Desarmillaria tabescens]
MAFPVSSSPPRAPPVKYKAPLGTRWEKEKAAAGGAEAFEYATDPKSIGPWIIGECVGKGASGRVKIAKHKHTGQLAAVKILPLAPLVNSRASLATQQAKTEKQRLGIDREITMMKLMNHPNILRIYDVYEGTRELFLILEYVEGGELFDFLVNKGRLEPSEALTVFMQIIYGLNYAHTFSIIHRDLKPENILIASFNPPLVKIADWGMAAFAPPSLHLETSCGSPHYASPEIVNGHKYQGTATDIWSCGIVLFALLSGRLPFDDKDVGILLSKVKSGVFKMPQSLDPLAKNLLSRMLVVDVHQRITIPEILVHPWVTSSSAALVSKIPPNPSVPPSPEVLARPILHPSLIDADLFSSLRIIWGKYTDREGESIKRDLCSPAGQGVHAKAFYFLLGKYREETSKLDGPNAAVADSMSFNLGWELDTKIGTGLLKKYDSSNRDLLPIQGRSRSVAAPIGLYPIPPSIRRTATTSPRERPASPAGPRYPAAKESGVRSAFHVPRSHPKTSFATAGGPRPQPPRRGYTFSHSTIKDGSTVSVETSSVQRAASHRVSAATQRPQSESPSKSSRRIDNNILPFPAVGRSSSIRKPSLAPVTPMLDASSHFKEDLFSTESKADDLLAKINGLTITDNHLQQQRMSVYSDKENKSVGEESWSYVGTDEGRSAIGLSVGRDVGREVGNLVADGDTIPNKGMKERKTRPPPLELPSLNKKRSTLSTLPSPVALSPPLSSVHTHSRLLTSPVVGEFKGWFSNLFSWKHQAHSQSSPWTLYSTDDSVKTCDGVKRMLEEMGVIVDSPSTVSPGSGGASESTFVRCRLDESSYGELANMKPFTSHVADIELSFSSSATYYGCTWEVQRLCEQKPSYTAPSLP